MKNYLRFLSPVMLLLMAVMFGGGKIYAKEVTYSVASKTSVTASVALKGVTTSFKNTYDQNKSDKAQVTGGNDMTLTIKGFTGTVSAVRLNQKATKSGTGKLTISINGNDVVSKSFAAKDIPNSYSDYIYNIDTPVSTTGDIVIKLSATVNSLYCNSFTLVYDDEEDTKTKTTLSFPKSSYTYKLGQDGGTVTIEDNIAVLKDKDGNKISDATGKITYSVESSVEDFAILGDENSSGIIVNTNKEGTATVTATFDAAGTDEKYSTSTATYTIKVTKRQTTLSFGETYDGKTINVNLGDEFTAPTATLTPNIEGATIKYSSNKPTVATVDETTGAVTIVGVGTAVITANFAGDETYGASTASYTINVVKPATVEDGVFDFTGDGTIDYGSGLKPSSDESYIKASTWKAGKVTMTTSEGNGVRWWITSGDNELRVYEKTKIAFSVPDGYVITYIDLGVYNNIEADCGNLNNTKWNGSSQVVTFTVSKTKKIKNITVKYAEILTTSAGGYATYSADYAVNYSELGLTAYTLTVDETKNTVTAKEFTGVVPAGAAVLVKGAESTTYTLTPATTEGDATFATDLKTGATKANGTQYGFTTKFGTPAFAQVASGQDIPAKKGYIVLSGASAAKYSICFGDEATGIQTIEAASAANAAMYNLAGQRVDKAYKGIVIVNGKKYLNK